MTDVMVVTGGGRGIGADIARRGARAGYRVCVNYKSDAEAAQGVVSEIEAGGGVAIAVPADVGDPAAVARLFAAVDERLGCVTALVNNAGVLGAEGRVEDLDPAVLAPLWATNISGCFFCAREAIARMSRRHGGPGGGIVNVSSLAGRMGGRDQRIAYATSKGAVNTFTLGLAKEVAADGIRVNAVLPGLTDTDFHTPYGGRERLDRLAPSIPLGRAAAPEEIGPAVLWLLSDEASYVTGALLEIAGGR